MSKIAEKQTLISDDDDDDDDARFFETSSSSVYKIGDSRRLRCDFTPCAFYFLLSFYPISTPLFSITLRAATRCFLRV